MRKPSAIAERGAFVVTPWVTTSIPDKRYPVIYFRHGYLGDACKCTRGDDSSTRRSTEAASRRQRGDHGDPRRLFEAQGRVLFRTGRRWATTRAFVGEISCQWVDATTARIPKRESRGLVGPFDGRLRHHARRDGSTRGVFSSLYAMSACCLNPMPIDAATANVSRGMTGRRHRRGRFRPAAPRSRPWRPGRPIRSQAAALRLHRAQDRRHARSAGQRAARRQFDRREMLPPAVPACPEQLSRRSGSKSATRTSCSTTTQAAQRRACPVRRHARVEDLRRRSRKRAFRERIRSELLPFFAEHLDK